MTVLLVHVFPPRHFRVFEDKKWKNLGQSLFTCDTHKSVRKRVLKQEPVYWSCWLFWIKICQPPCFENNHQREQRRWDQTTRQRQYCLYLRFYLFIYLYFYKSIDQFIYLSIYLSICKIAARMPLRLEVSTTSSESIKIIELNENCAMLLWLVLKMKVKVRWESSVTDTRFNLCHNSHSDIPVSQKGFWSTEVYYVTSISISSYVGFSVKRRAFCVNFNQV